MKATLEFDLNDSDDAMAHLRCVKALDMAMTLHEILWNTRKTFEYKIDGGEIKTPEELLEKIMDKLWDDAKEQGIIIDDLIR